MDDIKELFTKTLNIVKECGELLKNVDREKEASIKFDGTIVTKYDFLMEKKLTEKLKKVANCNIFSEEHFFEQNMTEKDKTYYIIDPIDGTSNFNAGYDCFGIIVGFVKDDVTLFSIVHFPILNKTYTAIKGEGAYLNQKKIYVKKSTDKIIGFCIISPESLDNLQSIINNEGNIKLRSLSCTAAETCLIAEGISDFYFSKNKCSLWDLVGTKLIIEEAGGIMKYEKSEGKGKYNVIAGTKEGVKIIEDITKIV